MPRRFYISGRSAAAIATSIERGVRIGELVPGERLPAVRALAAQLAVSPSTISAAYRTLQLRGVTVAAGRGGTTVAPRPPISRPGRPLLPAHVRDLASGNPDPALLPDLGPALRRIDHAHLLYGEPGVVPALADLARRRLHADGVDPTHLTVTGGALDGIERVLSAHARPGDRVAVEDPGYLGVLDLCSALGLLVVPVAVDANGCIPGALEEALPRVRACVFTPRGQNPTGASWDARRATLLSALLVRRAGVLTIIDDHAAGIAGTPLHMLRHGPHWAYLRSVSKGWGPDLRLAVLAGDAVTLARVEGRRALGTGWVSRLLQRVVADLWTDPVVERQLEHAGREYSRRREALLEALRAHGIEAVGSSGINVWVPVAHEEEVSAALLAGGWGVAPGARFRIAAPPAIRVTTATLQPGEATAFAAALARALEARPTRFG